jgi:hypothetical protein
MEAAHYEEARRKLAADPIIRKMYEDLPDDLRRAVAYEEVEDRSSLMTMALREYNDRGGEVPTHIGGPLEALEIVAREDYPTCEQTTEHGGRRVPAEVYAIDPIPDGWGGRYCRTCADKLRFQVVDVL